MADPKYKTSQVPLSAEQNEIVQAAVEKFVQEFGVRLSRSQILAYLAKKYTKENDLKIPS